MKRVSMRGFIVAENERKRLDNGNDEHVIIPSHSALSEMDEHYAKYIADLKHVVATQRVSIALRANAGVICLYWNIGRSIIEQQAAYGWGAKVIDRISHDLREEFPDAQGFSPRNLKYMRRFAETWSDFEFVQRLVAQIPWGANIELMQKVENHEQRVWYAQQALENGWSRDVLVWQVRNNTWERGGKAVNNFDRSLPPIESDMVPQVFKDPSYILSATSRAVAALFSFRREYGIKGVHGAEGAWRLLLESGSLR